MIVYEGSKADFINDSINGVIANKIETLFSSLGIFRESLAEFRSWVNSLPRIALIIGDNRIDDMVRVALEYQIPLTSKRVDFMIGGKNKEQDNVVVIELKQWESCKATSRENVVNAFTGGANRDVAHPSHQAYSYAKLIENFNEDVREKKIGIIPCAYLHNYHERERGEICHPKYKEAIDDAPVFLQEDGKKLADYITTYVTKPSDKNLFDIIENGKLKPSKSLQDTIGSILNENEEFVMVDEQQVAYATVLKLVQNTIESNEKHTIIVRGGPGTGKSVIAINLLAKILNNGFSCSYVTKTSAPRTTFKKNITKGKHKLGYLKGLFVSSGILYKYGSNKYDCLLTDEAHRLNEKSGLYRNEGENQIKEIINASKISVFFIDEDQRVTTRDIGTLEEIKRQAKALNSTVHCNSSLELTSQFRCNGSNGYIAFLDNLLQIRQTANTNFYDLDYDIRVFDNACEMREELRKHNNRNKARMMAGYCYDWKSKNDKTKSDIVLPNGFEAQWNFTTDNFATDENSFEQVGCIHSTQGLEFDYAGVIIGKDLIYRDGKVLTDINAISKDDKSSGIRTCKDKSLADRLVRNTYKVLLTRGQKGCFVYCEDEKLRDYIKLLISH